MATNEKQKIMGRYEAINEAIMKRSKKGNPMSPCTKCKKDTADIQKMGGVICGSCHRLKVDYEKLYPVSYK